MLPMKHSNTNTHIHRIGIDMYSPAMMPKRNGIRKNRAGRGLSFIFVVMCLVGYTIHYIVCDEKIQRLCQCKHLEYYCYAWYIVDIHI